MWRKAVYLTRAPEPQRLKAAVVLRDFVARVKLVPFPVGYDYRASRSLLGLNVPFISRAPAIVYGVTARVNERELVSGVPPPVVAALTVTL